MIEALKNLENLSENDLHDLESELQNLEYLETIHNSEQDFKEFKKHLKTFDRDGNILPFPNYAYLSEMDDRLINNRKNIWEKSRQMMATWEVASFQLWIVWASALVETLFISKIQDDSVDYGRRLKFMHDHLPEYMQRPNPIDKTTEFGLAHSDPEREGHTVTSIAKFLPQSKSAGRGTQAKHIALDEFAFQQWARRILTAVKPAMEKTGSIVILSTHDGPNTTFNEYIENAEKLGYKKLAIHYSMDPTKDAAWVDTEKVGYSEDEWEQEQEIKVVSPSGRVYNEFNETHILDTCALSLSGRFYLSLDFGFTNPSAAILVYSPGPDYHEYVIIDEVYETKLLTEDFGDRIIEMLQVPIKDKETGEMKVRKINMTMIIADREDPQARKKLSMKPWFLPSTPSAGGVRDGIKEVKKLLRVSPETGRPRLFTMRHCKNAIKEWNSYREHEEKDGKNNDENPVKEMDHIMDCTKNLMYKLHKGKSQVRRFKSRGL